MDTYTLVEKQRPMYVMPIRNQIVIVRSKMNLLTLHMALSFLADHFSEIFPFFLG